jgi:hypothetical protein
MFPTNRIEQNQAGLGELASGLIDSRVCGN